MVFSPNTLQGAPHNLLATVTLPKSAACNRGRGLSRTLGKAYPAVTAIRVKDAIDAFNTIFAKVMIAVRVAGGVTLLAGALVLAGALATAQRRRIQEAVILKTLGATRRRILTSHLLEYALLASITAHLRGRARRHRRLRRRRAYHADPVRFFLGAGGPGAGAFAGPGRAVRRHRNAGGPARTARSVLAHALDASVNQAFDF